MADSTQFAVFQALVFVLGALGLFSIGALPLRTYSIARRLSVNQAPTWQVLTVLIAALCAVALAGQFLYGLGKCLLISYRCSANASGGWINAAFIGAIYVLFELALVVVRWVAKHRRVAT